MSKRQSLKGKGIDSLLFGFGENHKILQEAEDKKEKLRPQKAADEGKRNENNNEIERVTVPLRLNQVEALTNLERKIMKRRSRKAKKQRITKNAIIRACLDVFLELDIDVEEIPNEAELTRRIYRATMS